ncbi:hypothetical protein [Telluribacter sp. SYSU D00476]|uniref:hypothetical protein n=1 Tax=Telluribacter sp. SYSU D00476 TaxID=2811430 RepID=UPI001FF3F35C|nr:hypothetical protein [Telluribacter sp. SYSU D00476]
MKTNNKLLLGFVLTLPVLFWVYVLLRYSVNVPWFDDFEPFPDLLHKWILSDSLSEKITLLFHPNNEHRMVFGKLLTVIYYWVTGTLHFTYLHIVGALFTFGTFALFWKVFRSTGLSLKYFLPVPFLLFQIQYHLIFLWAICSLQHQPVVFFVCLTMYLLVQKRFGWAILAGFCANFAMSNGIFVWVGGAAILLLWSQWRQLGIWIVAGGLAIWLYFQGMTTMGNEASIEYFKNHPHLSFLGFFAFLGGLFDFFFERPIQIRTALPVLMGLLTMLWVVPWLLGLVLPWVRQTLRWPAQLPRFTERMQATITHQQQVTYFSLGVMVFILSNAAIIGFLRPRFGFEVMVVSNYKIYPAVFLIVGYLAYLGANAQDMWRTWGFRITLGLGVFIWAMSLLHYLPAIIERRKSLLVNVFNQEHHSFGLGHFPGTPTGEYVEALMQDVTARGIYAYPDDFKPYYDQMRSVQTPLPPALRVQIQTTSEAILVLEPDTPYKAGFDTGSYAFLRQGKELYVFRVDQNLYRGRNIFRLFDKGRALMIPYSLIPPGEYELGVLRVGDGQVESGIIRSITISEEQGFKTI